MSEEPIHVEFETRPAGVEDLAFDETGNNQRGTFTDAGGTVRSYRYINAVHIPLSLIARARIAAANVEDALLSLLGMIGGEDSGGRMTEDVTLDLPSSGTADSWQAAIDECARDLGGHTLTVVFPEALDVALDRSLQFDGLHNGILKIDLNENTVFDGVALEQLFAFADCNCRVWVTNGTLKHTLSPCAVRALRCPSVFLDHLTFVGYGTGSGSLAFIGVNSGGYSEDITLVDDLFASENSIFKTIVDAMFADHNAAGSAHSALFALKAPLADPAFTGTPTAPTATDGTNSTQIATTAFTQSAVSAHNAASDAHSTLLAAKAPLADPAFTGTPTAPTAAAGTNSTQIATTAFVRAACALAANGAVTKAYSPQTSSSDAFHIHFSNGMLIQGGIANIAAGQTQKTVTLTKPYSSSHYTVLLSDYGTDGDCKFFKTLSTRTTSAFTAKMDGAAGADSDAFFYVAIGYANPNA